MEGSAVQLYTLHVISHFTRTPFRLQTNKQFVHVSQPFYFHSVFHGVCRLEQEKSALQKRLKARGVTADQVVGVRSTEMEKEIEELKKKNSELETQILTIK